MRAVLMYHSIDMSGSPISVSPAAFRAHMLGLAARGVRAMGIADVLKTHDSQDAVAITFDDALTSVREIAAPLLAELGLRATVFVPTAHVGGDNQWRGGDRGIPRFPLMSWNDLGALQERGWTIGAHTRTHARLTRSSDNELQDEILGSAADIQRELGERPKAFAYPYGRVDERVAAAAARAFKISCTTEMRVLRLNESRGLVPRIDAYYFRGNDLLTAWGTRRQQAYLELRHALRSLKRALSPA